MKILKSMLLMVIMVLCLASFSFAGLNDGFRTKTWGTSVTKFTLDPDYYHTKTKAGFRIYQNKKENLSLGKYKVKSIEYCISVAKNEFELVNVYFEMTNMQGTEDIAKMLTGMLGMKATWSPPCDKWNIGNVLVFFNYNDNTLQLLFNKKVKESKNGTF